MKKYIIAVSQLLVLKWFGHISLPSYGTLFGRTLFGQFSAINNVRPSNVRSYWVICPDRKVYKKILIKMIV